MQPEAALQLATQQLKAGDHVPLEGVPRPSVEDIDVIAPAILRHRIILNFDAHAEGQNPETILTQIIPSVSKGVTAAVR